FYFSSRRRHTRSKRDWSSDVCSSDLIQKLLNKAKSEELLHEQDEVYARNQMMSLLNKTSFSSDSEAETRNSIPNLLDLLVQEAIKENIIEDVFDAKEQLQANLMNCLLPLP